MRLEDLNDSQKRAVKYTDGALLIIAGAGSGKTRVLTNRIAYLIEECGVDPYNIMAITFTNKAAREMKERVETTVAQGGRGCMGKYIPLNMRENFKKIHRQNWIR